MVGRIVGEEGSKGGLGGADTGLEINVSRPMSLQNHTFSSQPDVSRRKKPRPALFTAHAPYRTGQFVGKAAPLARRLPARHIPSQALHGSARSAAACNFFSAAA